MVESSSDNQQMSLNYCTLYNFKWDEGKRKLCKSSKFLHNQYSVLSKFHKLKNDIMGILFTGSSYQVD